jgi:NAD(P)-dependent dehydrogenase (short-subunit alcohol dehydrogenase family)
MSSLDGAVVLVTGANGGIGTHFVHDALDRGAARVYATARRPRDWADERVVPLGLDVTDPHSIAEAVAAAPDVTVLVNNAGVAPPATEILTVADADIRATMETNFFGPLFLARAYAPLLAGRDGAAIIALHSALSWYAAAGIYSASKAALWSATNSVRLELAPRGVHVIGVHVGWVDTPMAAGAAPGEAKTAPADLVRVVYDALEAGEFEVLADDTAKRTKAGLSAPVEAVYPQLTTRRG